MPTPDMTPENQALCDAARAVVERDFKPRPGAVCSIAPNGLIYLDLLTKPGQSASEAVQELEGRFRALIVEYPGDTVWWRKVPEVHKDTVTGQWRARARLRLGWASDEIPERIPGNPECVFGPAYPVEPPAPAPAPTEPPSANTAIVAGLPRWKCHKEVHAAKVVNVSVLGAWKIEGGYMFMPSAELVARAPKPSAIIGGYYVRYADGYESWSPAKAFEDGYTRMEG